MQGMYFWTKTIINNFRDEWKNLDVDEKVETFELDMFDDIQSAVPSIIDTLGMTACDGPGVCVILLIH